MTITSDFADDVVDLTHRWVTDLRIPIVRTPYPRWKYEVAVVVPDGPDADLWHATWPTDDEAVIIADYIDYRRDWYNAGWKAKMLERPLDVDSGTNTTILIKREDGWAYRRPTWTAGYPVVPPMPFAKDYTGPRYSPDADGLRALLDRINGLGDGTVFGRWAEWKRAEKKREAGQ